MDLGDVEDSHSDDLFSLDLIQAWPWTYRYASGDCVLFAPLMLDYN